MLKLAVFVAAAPAALVMSVIVLAVAFVVAPGLLLVYVLRRP